MAIEDILKALEAQSQADCDECLGEAQAHAEHILTTARQEAEDIKSRHVQQIERAATSKASQTVNAARLEGKMLVSSVKGEGLESVFAGAESNLGNVRQGPGYQGLLTKLVDEALEGTTGEVTVKANPADVGAIEQQLAARGVAGRVVGDDSIAGGVLVELNGGKILRRNTLADRLERARGLVQNDVAKVILA